MLRLIDQFDTSEEMSCKVNVGDRVKFRAKSKVSMRHGLEPGAKGYVVEVYHDPEARGGHKVDVRFPGTGEPERGIDIAELEVFPW